MYIILAIKKQRGLHTSMYNPLKKTQLPEQLTILFIVWIFVFIFLGFGFLIMGFKSTGDIRKNFFLLSTGAFLYIIGGLLDGLFDPSIHIIFARAAMIISALFFYAGLKE